MEEYDQYLKPTFFIDSNSEKVIKLSRRLTKNIENITEKAKALFYWTRDEILYNPYDTFTFNREDYKASNIIAQKKGWCVQKACVLAALARAIEIPSRLHFADIRNHRVPEKLLKAMKTNLFVYHGYTELLLNGSWIKATPAFNKELCLKFNLKTVEFDGIHDGMLPDTTTDGQIYIEYIKDRGITSDFPFDELFKIIRDFYGTFDWQNYKGD
ncbi:MAG: transglutaminase domain-containing protein [Promethearchaeota archaeon]|nr:MAG: transglutaminase domain-containing protein [Candidatus Lokiarchaeota archaeon]